MGCTPSKPLNGSMLIKPISKQPEILILYASETGNCEAISQDLYEKLLEQKPLFKNMKRFALNDHLKKTTKSNEKSFDLTAKDNIKVCIFIVSSTGDGEMPQNGEIFNRFLMRQTNPSLENNNSDQSNKNNQLSHVFFTMLGLGNTNYSMFQGNPRQIDTKLKQLGAQSFYYRGEADEGTSLELVVEPWLEGLQPSLEQMLDKISQFSNEELIKLSNNSHQVINNTNTNEQVQDIIIKGKVINGKYVMKNDQQNRYIIEADIKLDQPVTSQMIDVGESFQLYPQNSQKDIDEVCNYFQWDQNSLIGNLSVKELIKNQLDIRTQHINVKKYMDSQQNQLTSELMTIQDIIRQKVNVKIDASEMEDNLPKIRYRNYSIINDPHHDKSQQQFVLKICFTLHQFANNQKVNLEGFGTSFIKSQVDNILNNKPQENEQFKCKFNKVGKILRLPIEHFIQQKQPLVILAQGTGVTPFLSIFEKIQNIIKDEKKQDKYGSIYMFYGIRNNEEEFIYKSQLLSFFNDFTKTHCKDSLFYLACSRGLVNPVNTEQVQMKKGYCQDYFKDQQVKTQIHDALVNQKGMLMMCGNQKTLGNSVLKDFVSGETQIFTEDEFKVIKDSHRMLLELWNE